MKILHVFDHSIPLHSGYTFRSRSILLEQIKRGWEVVAVTSSKHDSLDRGPETVDGLTFYRTPRATNFPSRLPALDQMAVVQSTRQRILDVVTAERPDCIHAHSPALNGLAALSAARKCGLPVVYEVRAFWEDAAVDHGTAREWGLRYRATRALESYVLSRANAVTTICEGLRSEIVGRGIPESKITVIPNAVDAALFRPVLERSKLLEAELGLVGRPVLGFAGSFYAYEGLDILLEASVAIRESVPNLCVLLVGGGTQEASLRKQVSDLGLEATVRFVGRVPHARVNDYYSLIDLLVYPRKCMRLTDLVTPLKPLEAMAQMLPVLASDVGGHRELIKDGVNGALFRAGSAESLCDQVLRILGNEGVKQRLRLNGRTFVESERTWALSVQRYEDVYGRAIQSKASAGK